MSLGPPTKLRVAAVPVGLLAYASLCHWSNSTERGHVLGAPLAVTPFLAIGFGALWRYLGRAGPGTELGPGPRMRSLALGATLIIAALLSVHLGWQELKRNFAWIYLFQECGFYGVLAFGFGRSLRRGVTPLCTLLADQVHGPLSMAELRYTRAATTAWFFFFATLVLLELALFFIVPLATWSFFSYFCTLPLVLLMFVAEYAVRRRVLPPRAGAGLWATMRIYFARSA